MFGRIDMQGQLYKIILSVLVSLMPLMVLAQQSTVPQFKDYPATQRYQGKAAKVILDDSAKQTFRTRLRQAAQQPADFAGDYVLAVWGCGADCLMGAAVNRQSGQVIFLPGSVCCWWGEGDKLTYRHDSRLLVAAGIINEQGQYGAHFYEFTGRAFRLIRTIPLKKEPIDD